MPSILLIDLYLARHAIDTCWPTHRAGERDEEDISRMRISLLALPYTNRLDRISERVMAIVNMNCGDTPLSEGFKGRAELAL